MILRPEGEKLLAIAQADHAALAGRIMERWALDGLTVNPRRREVLLAVAEHDNGWEAIDQKPLVDAATGRLMDFLSATTVAKQEVWPRGIASLSHAPYAAALVAQHAAHIYARFRGDAEWDSFFADMEAQRDRYVALAGASLDELLRDYAFVRVGDLLSLTFCNAWTDAKTDEFGYTARLEGTNLTVQPDPFEGHSFVLEIRARELPKQVYASEAEATAAFEAAPGRLLQGMISGV